MDFGLSSLYLAWCGGVVVSEGLLLLGPSSAGPVMLLLLPLLTWLRCGMAVEALCSRAMEAAMASGSGGVMMLNSAQEPMMYWG